MNICGKDPNIFPTALNRREKNDEGKLVPKEYPPFFKDYRQKIRTLKQK